MGNVSFLKVFTFLNERGRFLGLKIAAEIIHGIELLDFKIKCQLITKVSVLHFLCVPIY